jgi:hypothetical protein
MSNYNSSDCDEKLKQCEEDKNKLVKGFTGFFLQIMGIEVDSLSENTTDEDFNSIGKKVADKLKSVYKL